MEAGAPAFRVVRALGGLFLTVAIGGFAASALVRFSPGFDVDENAWNPAISRETAATIHARREYENELGHFYIRYLSAAAHGDFGTSDSFRVPVAELLASRAPLTAGLLIWGVCGGMMLGGMLAWIAVWPGRAGFDASASTISGLLLAIPPAVLALAFFFARAPIGLATALAIVPRAFGTLRVLWTEYQASDVLVSARARGVSTGGLLWRYVLWPAAPRLMALAGVNLVIALGLLIPIEAICDVPGIGQLMWKAAVSRDLPVLCALALIVTGIVAVFAAVGQLAGGDRSLAKDAA